MAAPALMSQAIPRSGETIMYDTDDIEDVLATYGLPELPDPDEDDEEGRELVLYRFKDHHIVLAGSIPLADAMEYCDREDTHDTKNSPPLWFVGFRR